MTPTEAATALVELYGRFTRLTHESDKKYEQAIAMACAALDANKKEVVMRGE